jgi:hypothetical protein
MTAIAAKAPESHVFNLLRPKPVIDNPAKWLDCIIWVESGSGMYNSKEPEAVGILQQHPVFVDDVNRILKKKRFSYDDRLDPKKAASMFFIYQNYYNPEMNFEKMCRIQVSGPDGMKKKCSDAYYFAVRDKLYSDIYR